MLMNMFTIDVSGGGVWLVLIINKLILERK